MPDPVPIGMALEEVAAILQSIIDEYHEGNPTSIECRALLAVVAKMMRRLKEQGAPS